MFQDLTKWEKITEVANVYNRLILYDARQFHMSLDYFGNDMYDGRLFQTFFFSSIEGRPAGTAKMRRGI